MTFETEFLEMFPQTISVEPFVSRDRSGDPTYGAAVEYPCLITDDVKNWRWEAGDETQGRRRIHAYGEAIGQHDRITLPDGMEPSPVTPTWIVKKHDADGYHHTVIYL